MSNPVSVYEGSVVYMRHGLKTLRSILEKSQEHASKQDIKLDDLAQARLAPDMFTLAKQVVLLNYFSRMFNIYFGDAPEINLTAEIKEPDWKGLYTWVNEAESALMNVNAETFEGKLSAKKIVKLPKKELTFEGSALVTQFLVPNFWFHLNMVYAVLRNQGIPLGKHDYLSGFMSYN